MVQKVVLLILFTMGFVTACSSKNEGIAAFVLLATDKPTFVAFYTDN